MRVKSQFSACCECEDSMYKNKPTREPGQDIRTLPTYTIPEAAEYLGFDTWMLFDWYSGPDPVLKPSGYYSGGPMALLSFEDIEEAYKLYMLRTKFGYSMQYLRKALADARQKSKSDHPLIDHKIVAFTYLALYCREGRKGETVVALGPKQMSLYIAEVVDTWGKRIIADRKGRTRQIFPWRYAHDDDRSRPVSLDPDVLSGRLVVTGTRIPVRVLKSRRDSGDSVEAIAKDYGISAGTVEKALIHFDPKTPRTVHSVS
jgi:uncharacterized protein (DUF433 family)